MMCTIHWYFSKIKDMTFKPTDTTKHTFVAELSSWSPDQTENVMFMLYDVGGHDSYKNTAHVFQVGIASTVSNLKKNMSN